MTKQVLIIGTAVMTALLALAVAWEFRLAIVYLFVSLILAAALRPLVNRLRGRGFVVRSLWIMLYLVALGSITFLLFVVVKAAVSEVQSITQLLSKQDEWLLPNWLRGSLFQEMLVARLPPPNVLFEPFLSEGEQLEIPAIINFTESVAEVTRAVFVILLLSLYWIVSQTHFERLWLSLLPATQRKQARDIWRTVEPELGAYIRSQLIQAFLVGVLLSLGYWAIGTPYPVSLALGGVLASMIPVVGSALAIILPALVGLLTNMQLGLFIVLYTVLIFIVMGLWIGPRFFKRSGDNPIITLFILTALADAFGLLGIIIAPPVSAVFQILWDYMVNYRVASGPTAQISDLKERHESVWAIIKAMDTPINPLVSSSIERLDRLIEKATPILEETLPDPTPETPLPEV